MALLDHLSRLRHCLQAMRTGNVQQLNQALDQHQWTFIQMGTYLVMEKLRYAVYRRLFRRVHGIHAESCEPSKSHLLPLSASTLGLQLLCQLLSGHGCHLHAHVLQM